MLQIQTIRNKPIHIGRFVWEGEPEVFEGIEDKRFRKVCLSTTDSLVYCCVGEDCRLSHGFHLFQYIAEEGTEGANYVGEIDDLQLIKITFGTDDEGYALYYDDIESAIVYSYYPGFEDFEFKYYIKGTLLFDPSEDFLYGSFSRKESYLLKYLFREEHTPLTLEQYIAKKEEIRNTLKSLGISQYSKEYDMEAHIDSMMFKYIREEFEKEKSYYKSYIFPKILFWGK